MASLRGTHMSVCRRYRAQEEDLQERCVSAASSSFSQRESFLLRLCLFISSFVRFLVLVSSLHDDSIFFKIY